VNVILLIATWNLSVEGTIGNAITGGLGGLRLWTGWASHSTANRESHASVWNPVSLR